MSSAALPSRKSTPTWANIQEESKEGPVFLRDKCGLTHVLMTISDYQRILGGKLTIVEKLWMPGMPDIDFDPPRSAESARPADLS